MKCALEASAPGSGDRKGARWRPAIAEMRSQCFPASGGSVFELSVTENSRGRSGDQQVCSLRGLRYWSKLLRFQKLITQKKPALRSACSRMAARACDGSERGSLLTFNSSMRLSQRNCIKCTQRSVWRHRPVPGPNLQTSLVRGMSDMAAAHF
jgi:hypothetical protein